MKNNSLQDLYQIHDLLLRLSPELVDYSSTTEEEEIVKFVEKFDHESIGWTLEEGREVLLMEPFSWEWVQSMTQSFVYDEEKQKWVEDPILYRKWLKNVLDILEAEAKKLGKL